MTPVTRRFNARLRRRGGALFFAASALWLFSSNGWAKEEIITTAHYSSGDSIPYVLNSQSSGPKYVLILFPGGMGNVEPRMEGDKLVYKGRSNFLLRARKWFVDEEFATVSTNASQSPERMQGLLDDLVRRFPHAKIYLIGTSRGTFDTMELAGFLSRRIAGVIHTASLSRIGSFNAKDYANRQLLVHHRHDDCHVTPFSQAQYSHERFGNELIVMEGGTSIGDPCQAHAYHGFNGIEEQTVAAIKDWIKKGH